MKTGRIDLREIDSNHIWHPFTSFSDGREPIFVSKAEGVYLHTSDGRKIIDAISSWWVNLHGHSNPLIAEAISKQALTLEHVIFAGFTHEPAILLTSNLLKVLPKNQSRIFFSDNGSTSVEVGIKMAIQYWHNKDVQKRKIIAFEGAYHGDTFGSMSVGSRGPFTTPFDPFLFDVDFIEVPTHQNIETLSERFRSLTSTGDVAAFIYEPLVQGASGMIMYEPEHLEALLHIAQEHNVICIADEVFTGFGRTGKWFASHYLKNLPDIICVSKGITGGTLPLGVTACSKKIVSAFQSEKPFHTFFHGHSYTANPISCAAANASFEILSTEESWKNIERINRSHQDFIARIGSHPLVYDARCLGTIMAIEIKTGENTSYFNSIKRNIYNFFLNRNILLRPLGNIVYILPPYIITTEELTQIYDAIEEFLDSIPQRN